MCAVICADLIPDFFAETGGTGEVTTKKMNVLMLNGSPNPNVNTSIVLREMENVFRENGVESETVFAATGIFTAALRPENASLPASRTSLSRNSRRRKHCLRSVRHSARQGAVRSQSRSSRSAVQQAIIYSLIMLKKPGNTPFSGLFLCPKFCLDCSVLMEFERKFMGL